ncbi:MAG: FIST C-terminal domain-containing protein [Magnetospirillum sp.]|nr:FIST C-terminal domain-containing protein [Magnetospirillum sp.]
MHVGSGRWTAEAGWQFDATATDLDAAQLVLYFAAPGALTDGSRLRELRQRFPVAKLVGCTTGGEIFGAEVYDGTIAVAAIRFARAHVALHAEQIDACGGSFEAGRRLGAGLPHPGLRGVFVLSDGTRVNGSELVRGLKEGLPEGVVLTGGLAGDGAAFKLTLVGADRDPVAGTILALGFYGDSLDIRHGSFGGWDTFGPERRITRSDGNILYELDGEPALDLYKRYLGEEAARLPGSALLFPLRVKAHPDQATEVVRTVVGIDEPRHAMIFAGDVPTGSTAQLMHGDFEHLIEGAGMAARQAYGDGTASLAILVSCIGRKLLLGQRIAEEVEAVTGVLGPQCVPIGFYSYGEISPHDFSGSCELHNQTMTITVIHER